MAQPRASIPARHVVAVVVGNALEFYDFLTYAYFAVYIGKAFSPSSDPWASLLASLGAFGVGFIMRPVGGFVIGRMGDLSGRKPSMILSFWLMGFAMLGFALTPTYAKIGLAAPFLVIFFRMLQGFALGGEGGPTAAFLLEAAPAERRGFYAAFQPWTQNVSILVSGLVGVGLVDFLTPEQLQNFGWRLAFLVGLAIVPVGLLMRRSLPETFRASREKNHEHIPLRPYLPVAVLGLLLIVGGTIGTYIRTYMTTYAITTLRLRANVAFAATVVTGLCGVLFYLVGGAISDRIGRRPVILVPGTMLLVSILPAFRIITYYHTAGALLGAIAVLSSLAVLSGSPVFAWLSESFPPLIRSSGFGVVYAVSVSLFGGTTQYAVTWLIKVTGNPLMPAWYWTAAMVVCVLAAIAARESAPRKLAGAANPSIQLADEIAG